MVQSINIKAITTLATVIRRPYIIAPHVHVANISEIDFPKMRDNCGIKAVIFDKDNTLTAPYENRIHPDASVGLQNALKTFGPNNVAILSNSAGTNDDVDFEDAKQIESDLGISVIRHSEKKPGGLQETMNHFKEVEDPSQLCMVGDRLLTDIVFGNLYGMLSVHCLPLCSGDENEKDNKVANKIRKFENFFFYTDWFGSRLIRAKTLPHPKWVGEKECPLILELTENESK